MAKKKKNRNPEINDIVMGSPAESSDVKAVVEEPVANEEITEDIVKEDLVTEEPSEPMTITPDEIFSGCEIEPVLVEEEVAPEEPVSHEPVIEKLVEAVVEEPKPVVEEVPVESETKAPIPKAFGKSYRLIFAKNPSPLRKNTIEKKLKAAQISYSVEEEDGAILYVSRNYSTKEEAVRDRKEILKIGLSTVLDSGR